MIVLPHSNQLFARNGPEQTNGWKSCQKIDGSGELETRPLGGGEGGSSSYFFSRYWIHPRTFISRLLIYLIQISFCIHCPLIFSGLAFFSHLTISLMDT